MRRIWTLFKRAVKVAFRRFGLEVTRASPQQGPHLAVFGEFISSGGEKFQLLRGYRNALWPLEWDKMNRDRTDASPETVSKLGCVSKGRDQVAALREFLAFYDLGIEGREVLEVGCFDGAASYALKEAGAQRVHGIDSARNFIESKEITESACLAKKEWLDELRRSVRDAFLHDWKGLSSCEKVSFSDVDVTDLDVVGQYDLVLSTSTVEHLLDPPRAFAAMFSALRRGGISMHQYHPFFCLSGAHFDTLDFPWGHVRLSDEDFLRYISEFRPNELEIAEYRFFRTINRLTIAQLREVAVDAGFNIIELFAPVSGWNDVTPSIFQQCRTNYATLTLTDLAANGVWLILQKPA